MTMSDPDVKNRISAATEADVDPAGLIVRPGTRDSNRTEPAVRAPLLDIVVLVHDQAGWADLCIRSVEHHTKNPYRLILVDSASVEQGTRDVLDAAERRGHTVLHLAENRSFSEGVNAGAEIGSAPFICFLNNDCVVTEGWDGALLQDASTKTTGLVGARSNYASGAQGDPSFTGEPPYLVFVCVALRREVWDVVGNLDAETFDGFGAEDIDYAFRVKKAGYKLKVSSAYVLHAGSRTLSAKLGSADALARNNQRLTMKLAEKWGRDFVVENSKMALRVLVATYHAEDWAHVQFMGALMGLKRSDGMTFSYHHMTRSHIALGRTAIADFAVDQGFDALVQLDGDATFPMDLLRRLSSHQKDVVCALAYGRRPPYLPCIYELIDPDKIESGGKPLEGYEHTGLRKVDVSGFHCSMIRTSVFKKLRAAGIKGYYGDFRNPVAAGEDFLACGNMKKVGVQVYCDTDLIAGHIASPVVVDEAFRTDWCARNPPR